MFTGSPKDVPATSPFYNACRNNDIELVKHYLETMSVEEINQMEPNGSTALHVAAYRGYEKIVELLLMKGASYSTVNKYNNTPFDEAKTDKIKQMIRRRMNMTRFVSDSVEWIISTNDADYQAHEYMQILQKYGQDPHFYQLIDYIKQNYIEKDLKDIRGIDEIKQYFDMAIKQKDPIYLLKAYTAETDFYSILNVHLAQIQLESLNNQENLSRAYFIGILAHHLTLEKFSFTGTVYRGMIISNNDLKQYKKGTRILTKTFSSSSKLLDIATTFHTKKEDIMDRLPMLCIYEIRNRRTALDIENISLFQYEQEVLILPYSAFKIIDIKINKDNSPAVEIKLKECEPW